MPIGEYYIIYCKFKIIMIEGFNVRAIKNSFSEFPHNNKFYVLNFQQKKTFIMKENIYFRIDHNCE